MVPGRELVQANVVFDALALDLGGRSEILAAHEVRCGLLAPRDLAGWLRERRKCLTREAGKRLLGGGLVAVLQEELPDQVGVHANGAVLAGHHPWRWLGAVQIGLGLAGFR